MTDARTTAGLSTSNDTPEVFVKPSKQTKDALQKDQQGVSKHNHAPSQLGESGSHGNPESKKGVGGAAQIDNRRPRLTEAVLNENQKRSRNFTTRSENGQANKSAAAQK